MHSKCRSMGVNFVVSSVLVLASLASPIGAVGEDGLRWQMQQNGSKASLRGLCVVNRNVAWASGANGTVLKTVNAGKSWQRLTLPATEKIDFRDVKSFADGSAVLLTAGAPARIYYSGDGRSWKVAHEAKSPAAFFDGMAFWDGRHGIAFSDPIDGHLLVVTTSDGGKSWRAVPKPPPTLKGEFGFAASGTSVAVAGDKHVWIGLGGKTSTGRARVFRSQDRGRTWSSVNTPLVGGESAGIFSLVFTDTMNGVAVGGDYKQPEANTNNITVTNDGGRTWKKIGGRRPSGFRSGITTAKHKGTRIFVTVGPNGTDISRDGGQSWQPMSHSDNHKNAFHSVGFAGGVLFASGASGRIGRLPLR